jgi:hypothetical protein
MRHATILVAILAFVPLASAKAQVAPPVKVGDRVRVTAADVGRREGTVQLLTTDSLVMRPEYGAWPVYSAYSAPKYSAYGAPNRLAIPFASVTRLELSMPGGSRAGDGALIGLLLGGVGGAFAAGAACASDPWFQDDAGGCAMAGAVVFGAGGALVGAIIGAMITGTRWEEVPLERLRLQAAPQRDGRFGLGAWVRF